MHKIEAEAGKKILEQNLLDLGMKFAEQTNVQEAAR